MLDVLDPRTLGDAHPWLRCRHARSVPQLQETCGETGAVLDGSNYRVHRFTGKRMRQPLELEAWLGPWHLLAIEDGENHDLDDEPAFVYHNLRASSVDAPTTGRRTGTDTDAMLAVEVCMSPRCI